MILAQLASASPSRAGRRTAAQRRPRGSSYVRVAVDWSSGTGADATVNTGGHVELVAGFANGPSGSWSCSGSEADWEQAIRASGCVEVVLTTWLGNEPHAKDMVLDLAERLTQRLKDSRPLVRVRFLQREKGRAA